MLWRTIFVAARRSGMLSSASGPKQYLPECPRRPVQRGFVTHLIAQSSDDVSHKILMEKSSGVETIFSTVVVDP